MNTFDTKLLPPEKVVKFFNILSNLGRYTCNRYKGYDKLNPHISPCEREVFVKRTVAKWFTNKYVIWYKVGQLGTQYKSYIYTGNICYSLDYKVNIRVNYFDLFQPDRFEHETLSVSNCLNLEGIMCKDKLLHDRVLGLVNLDLPEKTVIIYAYDWDKYPRRKKGMTDEELYETLKIEFEIKIRTKSELYKEAEKLRDRIRKEGRNIIFFQNKDWYTIKQ